MFRFENEDVQSFLENFEAVAQKHEQRRQKIKKEVQRQNQFFLFELNSLVFFIEKEDFESEKYLSEYRIPFTEKPSNLTKEEYKLLYIETLYTIKHKIGTTTTASKYSQGQRDLYAYAQEAFGLSPEEHHLLLNRANEEKVREDFRYEFV